MTRTHADVALGSIIDASDPDACHYSRWKPHASGYVYIRARGTSRRAHRVVYEALVGPIPEGQVLDHLCGHPACLNVRHLRATTHRENILRSNGMGARHARQTHCVNGHPFSPENTRLATRPSWHGVKRECIACARSRRAARTVRGQVTKPADRSVPVPQARTFGEAGGLRDPAHDQQALGLPG